MDYCIEELKKCKSFAILGGTFDPIHLGHIKTAKSILALTSVEKILFIPLGNPPHKDENNVSSAYHRLNMLNLAVEGEKDFLISTMEIERNGKTYTIDTIKELKKLLGNAIKFFFIIGTDELLLINTWKNYEELLKICSFIAVKRPGYKDKLLEDAVAFLTKNYDANIRIVEIPPVDVSSSEIRKNIKNGISIKGLIDEKVLNYIKENNLYN